MTRKILFTLIVLTGIVLFAACSPTQTSPTPEANLPNPASVYCEEQGNRAGIVSAPDGSQSGICVFPDGITCDEWAYFRGECTPAEQDAPKTSEPQAAPTEPLATTSDVLIPGGWATYTSQRCEFTISHPAEMEGRIRLHRHEHAVIGRPAQHRRNSPKGQVPSRTGRARSAT